MSTPEVTAYQRQYRQDNKDTLRLKKRAYRKTLMGRWVGFNKNARRRGIETTLTKEDYFALMTNAICHYCNTDRMPTDGHGLDRKDFNIGYVIENVVPCCYRCNSDKGWLEQLGFQPYERIVELLVELISQRRA